jgi:nucleotide-binding universal stress UspA family protein
VRERRGFAEAKVRVVIGTAGKRGVTAQCDVVTGQSGLECVGLAAREKPALIVKTRSKRSGWVRRFYGSPLDHLVADAGRPVAGA